MLVLPWISLDMLHVLLSPQHRMTYRVRNIVTTISFAGWGLLKLKAWRKEEGVAVSDNGALVRGRTFRRGRMQKEKRRKDAGQFLGGLGI